MNGEFEVIRGKLYYKGTQAKELEWVKETSVSTIGEAPEVVIATISNNIVKQSMPVQYVIKVSSSVPITDMDFDGNIIVVDENGNDLENQPDVVIKNISGTSEDTTRTATLIVDTINLTDGEYNIVVKEGSVLDQNQGSNEEIQGNSNFQVSDKAPDKPLIRTTPTVLEYWVSSNVEIIIDYTSDTNKKEYSFDGVNWYLYSKSFVISKNTTIYARGTSLNNKVSEISTFQVTKVDKVPPQDTIIDFTIDLGTVNGSIVFEDNESGIDLNKTKYIITKERNLYGVENEIWNTEEAKLINNNNQVLNSTLKDGTYYIQTLAVDMVGNKRNNISKKIVIKNSVLEESGYSQSKSVNIPMLIKGMTPIKWDNSGNIVTTTADDSDWYDYQTKKWANVQTVDGSIWVWIPRYEYKITNPHSSAEQTIDIKFLENINNVASTGYTVHPAFKFGSEELEGIWVAKFEASGNVNKIDIKPNVVSLRSTNINNIFNACRNIETNTLYGFGVSGEAIDSHLMKNVDWGAVAYLTQSVYGKNSEVWINPSNSYKTGQAGKSISSRSTSNTYPYNNTQYGVNASTTGNVYGIYDMRGGANEFVAAYLNNNNASLTNYGLSLKNADAKYKDIYTVGTSDSRANNYTANSNKKGDAIYETSNTYQGAKAWFKDYSYMIYSTVPFITRGGAYSNTTNAGIFNYYSYNGNINATCGFRPVLVLGNNF